MRTGGAVDRQDGYPVEVGRTLRGHAVFRFDGWPESEAPPGVVA